MAELKGFDVGLVVQSISNVLLTGADGVRSTHNVTPVVLQQTLWQLAVVTDQVTNLLDNQLDDRRLRCATGTFFGGGVGASIMCHDLGQQLPRMRAELEAWIVRFQAYQDHVNECVAKGLLLDWGCAYWCATSPLLFGWYPNERCTGVRMDQKVQKPPDMATPFSLINQALVLGAHMDTEGFLGMVTTFIEVGAEAGAAAGAAAIQRAVEAAIKGIREAMNRPGPGGTPPKPWARYAFGALVLGGLGLGTYLYVKK